MKAKQNGFVCLRIWLTASVCVFGLILQGCADVPEHMHVTEGVAPANLDKDVRFRTTYYFRVYDYCYNAKSRQQFQPVTDSLYRFELTGKANSRANHVRFESGTLDQTQIDPFGATIEQDKQTGRLRYVPQSEVQSRAKQNEVIEELNRLIELRQVLSGGQNTKDGEATEGAAQAPTAAITELDKQIKKLIEADLLIDRTPDTPATRKMGESTQVCPAGSSIQRGFQIMGPQGVKTFDQNERLVMAMSSDAKPLIAALQEVSGRLLKTEQAKQSEAELLLPLVREQLRVSDMSVEVLRHQDKEKLEEVNNFIAAIKSDFEDKKAGTTE